MAPVTTAGARRGGLMHEAPWEAFLPPPPPSPSKLILQSVWPPVDRRDELRGHTCIHLRDHRCLFLFRRTAREVNSDGGSGGGARGGCTPSSICRTHEDQRRTNIESGSLREQIRQRIQSEVQIGGAAAACRGGPDPLRTLGTDVSQGGLLNIWRRNWRFCMGSTVS